MSLSLIYLLLKNGNCGEITEFVDALSLIICGLTTAFKIIVPRINHKKVSIIIESAVDDWETIVDEKSRLTMLHYANIGRIVFIIQMSGAYAVGFPLIVLKLPFVTNLIWDNQANKTIRVPIGPTCWIPINMSTFLYFFYFTLQSIQLFIVCSAYIGSDVFFFGIAINVYSQLKLLNNSLKKFHGNRKILRDKKFLNDFIERHDHLLKLVKYFEDIYNSVILAQVGTDVLLTCISG